MKFFSVALLVCAAVAAVMAQAVDIEPREYDLEKAPEIFEKFIKDYNRHYKDEADKKVHYEAFYKSLQNINEGNKKYPAVTLGINDFADNTEEEWKKHLGLNTIKP